MTQFTNRQQNDEFEQFPKIPTEVLRPHYVVKNAANCKRLHVAYFRCRGNVEFTIVIGCGYTQEFTRSYFIETLMFPIGFNFKLVTK